MMSEAVANGLHRARLEPGPAGATPADRVARGKAARARVPRGSHAAFQPTAGRPDPVSLLERQAAARVPELLPIRYGRMLASPFAFFRGAALPMASDLAATPVSGLTVQACGDAHLSNFGIFASPERRLVFDINDFDETLPGPWEWDVKRLAASAEVAARDNGFSGQERREIVLGAVARYRRVMRRLAGVGDLEVWQASSEVDQLRERYQAILDRRERRLAGRDLARARDRSGIQALDKLIRTSGGKPRFATEPPLLVPVADLDQAPAGLESHLQGIVANYRRTLEPDRQFLISRYQVADMARKVVGVGSVGMRCWIILLLGRDPEDRLFLQVKEAVPAVFAPFVGDTPYSSEGQRVVAGQRLMQAASDFFLGWHRPRSGPARDYYVRQLRDWKFSLAVEGMDPPTMRTYARLCGQTLARAHARSGDRIAIAAYLGKSDVFDRAVADFAVAYADQNERDLASLAAAAGSGRVDAEPGVLWQQRGELADDLGGRAVGGSPEPLARVQAHPAGVALRGGPGPQRPGGVVDLRVPGGRVRMVQQEPVDQRPGRAAAEGPGDRGGGEPRVGQRRLVQRVCAAFRAAQERRAGRGGRRPRAQRRGDACRVRDAARGDERETHVGPGHLGQEIEQGRPAVRSSVVGERS